MGGVGVSQDNQHFIRYFVTSSFISNFYALNTIENMVTLCLKGPFNKEFINDQQMF